MKLVDPGALEALKNQLLAAGPFDTWRGQKREVASHLKGIEEEFSGRSALLLYHALLIVSIRRRVGLEQSLEEFFRIWREYRESLLSELDLRWLKSASDTLADHGPTPTQRAIAVSTSLLVNLVKAYETERQQYGISGTDVPAAQAGRPILFDGVKAFKIGWGDMVRNMAERIEAVCALDDLAGPIFREAFRRVHQNDTVLRRMLVQNRKPELAWAALPPAENNSTRESATRRPPIGDPGGTELDIGELVEYVTANHPAVFGGLPPGSVLPLVRALFADILWSIDATDEGVVRFGGLGEFRIRMVEREVDGKTVARKHVVFRPGA